MMISHKKLLPLVETGMDYPEEYLIKIYDIWGFEQSQFQNIQDYDKDFAFFVLNKIEEVIQEYGTPDFEIDPKSESHSYQLNKLERYTSRLKDIRERIALGFFFAYDKCYSYSNEIIISRTHSDYLFWFSLKLRQYDLNLQKTASFLAFHLEGNFNKNRKKFIELVEISLDQYPEFFSDRLRKTIDKWIEKLSPKKSKSNSVAQIDNETKGFENPDLVLVAQTDNGIKDPQSKKNQPHPKFTWNETSETEKQLNYLYISLVDKKYIDKINFKNFKLHFTGTYENIPAINWKTNQYILVYLIEKLKPYLNPEIYKGENKTIAIEYFAKHFHHKGKVINVAAWRKVKSENKDVCNEFTKSIDMIISNI